MINDQKRRLDDQRPAAPLEWDENAQLAPVAVGLTDEQIAKLWRDVTLRDIGTEVGPFARAIEAAALAAPASADNPSTAGAAKGGITDFERVCLTELCNRIVVAKDEPIAISVEAAGVIRRLLAAPALNPSEVRDQALAALKTISEFPVTDLIANMDAWNMKNIAIRAIKAADQQGALGEKGGDGA